MGCSLHTDVLYSPKFTELLKLKESFKTKIPFASFLGCYFTILALLMEVHQSLVLKDIMTDLLGKHSWQLRQLLHTSNFIRNIHSHCQNGTNVLAL